MLQTAYWALAIGLTMAGVGLNLQYQGEAFKRSDQTKDIGKKSCVTGIIWTTMGGIVFVIGFLVWAFIQLGLVENV